MLISLRPKWSNQPPRLFLYELKERARLNLNDGYSNNATMQPSFLVM